MAASGCSRVWLDVIREGYSDHVIDNLEEAVSLKSVKKCQDVTRSVMKCQEASRDYCFCYFDVLQ